MFCTICGRPMIGDGPICAHCDQPGHAGGACAVCYRVHDDWAKAAVAMARTPHPTSDVLHDHRPPTPGVFGWCGACGGRTFDGWCPRAFCTDGKETA